jgi:hypothetical protein
MRTKLNIAECKQVLEIDPSMVITCADGEKWFEPSVMRVHGFTTYMVSAAAFMHLKNKGYIVLDANKSRLANENTPYAVQRNTGLYTKWRKADAYDCHVD